MGVNSMAASAYPAEAIGELARLLDACGARWVIGGSTGLALRGASLDRAPRDIDIYADEEDASRIHARLASYKQDEPRYSETDRYKSILSHYAIGGAVVELVGNFRICSAGSRYHTEVGQMLHPAGDDCQVPGGRVRLVPLGHELIFNVLRERHDRCQLIGEWIRRQPTHHLPPLRSLLARNALTQAAIGQIAHAVNLSVPELLASPSGPGLSMEGN
jgi:hypothetical protein